MKAIWLCTTLQLKQQVIPINVNKLFFEFPENTNGDAAQHLQENVDLLSKSKGSLRTDLCLVIILCF